MLILQQDLDQVIQTHQCQPVTSGNVQLAETTSASTIRATPGYLENVAVNRTKPFHTVAQDAGISSLRHMAVIPMILRTANGP
jgi:hypothetical protein